MKPYEPKSCAGDCDEVDSLKLALRERTQQLDELRARLDFEALLAAFSIALVNADDEQIEGPIRSGLEQIAKLFSFDKVELYELRDDGRFERIINLCQGPNEDGFASLSLGDRQISSPWFWTQMAAGRLIRVRALDDLPSAALAEHQRLARRNAQSWLAAPLYVGNELVTLLSLETHHTCTLWPSAQVRGIELLGAVLASAIHRRRIHRRLQASEAQFRSLVQGQEEFVLQWLPDGQITFANAPWRRYMGLGSDDVIAVQFWNCIAEKDRRPVKEALSSLGFWKIAAEEEHPVTRPDGVRGWHQWTHRAIYSGEGERIEYQSVGRDVTRRKQAELALEEQRAMLARATRIATMSEMVGGLSHEVNQPLYAIKNFGAAILKMLDREPVDLALIREWAEMISTSAERAGEIIRRLREFLAGKQVDWQTVGIAELIDGAVSMVEFELAKRRIQLHRHIDPPGASIEADRVQLQQVLINLIRNAVEALQTLGEAEKEIVVSARALGGRVVLEVTDNGPGIPPEIRQNLFQAFQTTKPEGMGLGLTISRTIVNAHGGAIEFRPNEGGGASFSIVLPTRGPKGVSRKEKTTRDTGSLDVD